MREIRSSGPGISTIIRNAESFYAFLWGKFEGFSKPLTMEQQTDLDGLLSDIARELAARFTAQECLADHCWLDEHKARPTQKAGACTHESS